jgi:hypothetical protein
MEAVGSDSCAYHPRQQGRPRRLPLTPLFSLGIILKCEQISTRQELIRGFLSHSDGCYANPCIFLPCRELKHHLSISNQTLHAKMWGGFQSKCGITLSWLQIMRPCHLFLLEHSATSAKESQETFFVPALFPPILKQTCETCVPASLEPRCQEKWSSFRCPRFPSSFPHVSFNCVKAILFAMSKFRSKKVAKPLLHPCMCRLGSVGTK